MVTHYFVGKVTLIAGLNQVIECHNVLFHGFIYLLSLSVKASSLENNVSSNAKKCVKLRHDRLRVLSLVFSDIHGA